jgi:hypothetical protein
MASCSFIGTSYGPENCYQIATTLALRGRIILALEPNPAMGDTGLENEPGGRFGCYPPCLLGLCVLR